MESILRGRGWIYFGKRATAGSSFCQLVNLPDLKKSWNEKLEKLLKKRNYPNNYLLFGFGLFRRQMFLLPDDPVFFLAELFCWAFWAGFLPTSTLSSTYGWSVITGIDCLMSFSMSRKKDVLLNRRKKVRFHLPWPFRFAQCGGYRFQEHWAIRN